MMTAREMLHREQRTMGRPCTLIDTAKLQGGITIIVYETRSQPLDLMSGHKQVNIDHRYAISLKGKASIIAGGIVSSRWEEADE